MLFFRNEKRRGCEQLTKAPSGYDSVKGIGRTYPNPDEDVTLKDDVVVPLGHPVTCVDDETSLLYNEYPLFIVYLIANVIFIVISLIFVQIHRLRYRSD